jgi:hypothetical protein
MIVDVSYSWTVFKYEIGDPQGGPVLYRNGIRLVTSVFEVDVGQPPIIPVSKQFINDEKSRLGAQGTLNEGEANYSWPSH